MTIRRRVWGTVLLLGISNLAFGDVPPPPSRPDWNDPAAPLPDEPQDPLPTVPTVAWFALGLLVVAVASRPGALAGST